jgi:tetratricopeptide (TPR) repeat protein/DNA-binding CsgD family transcriptional regulator
MKKQRMMEQLPDGVLRRNDPVQAKLIAGRVLEQAMRANDLGTIVRSHHALLSCAVSMGDLEAAEDHVDRAHAVALEIPDNDLVAISIALRMELLKLRGEHQAALELGRDAFDLLGDTHEVSYARVLVLMLTASIHLEMAEYGKALACLVEATGYDGEPDNMVLRGMVLVNIGGIYRRLGNREPALEYLRQGLDLMRACGDRKGEMTTLFLIGQAYLELDRIDDAIAATEPVLEIARAMPARAMEIKALCGLGHAYEMLGDPDRALTYIEQALAIVEQRDNERERVEVLTYLAVVRMAQKDYDAAQTVLHEALATGERIGEPLLLWKPHELLARLYEIRGDTAAALHHYREFVTMGEDLFGQKQQQQVAHIQVEFERRILEQERENHRLKAASLEKDIEHRTNQMALLTTSLIQKRESLEKIQRDLRVIAETDRRANPRVKSLLEKVDEMLRSEQDWQTFERHFHQLHQGFIQRLAEACPALTPTELKICSLLKTNCSTKEIAGILCISRHTVDGHRAQVRRKLALSAEENLTAFLARFN